MKLIICCGVALLSLLVPRAALAACEEPTTSEQLVETVEVGVAAFGELDADALLTQSSLARTEILPCLSEKLTRQGAASFHRLMALEAFINGNDARVVAELHASLRLDPGYKFPEDIIDAGHPLIALYDEAAHAPDGEAEPVYPPVGGYVMVSGVRNAPRFSETPVIVQVYGPGDLWQETRYIEPGEALPHWHADEKNPHGLTAEDLGVSRTLVLKDPRPWYAVGGVTLITSGVFYGIAMSQKAQYEDPSTPDADLSRYERNTNGFGTAAVVSGSAGLALAGVGIGMHARFGRDGSGKPTIELTTPSEEDHGHGH